MPLTLSCSDRQELERRVRSQSLRADDVRRARLLLLLADGESYSAIQTILGCSSADISRWKKRFEAAGLSGLHGRQQGRQATVLTPALEAQILEKTRQKPSDGSTHWSTRKLARELGVRHQVVATVRKRPEPGTEPGATRIARGAPAGPPLRSTHSLHILKYRKASLPPFTNPSGSRTNKFWGCDAPRPAVHHRHTDWRSPCT